MASSSSAISPSNWKYDVFLSFRGTDTRNSFTSHLYGALCRNKIDAFIDHGLRGGEEIEPALLERIEQSYISIVVFSNNYSDSTFCLRELSKILECKKKKGQMVLPIFHQVNPSHVQELSGSFGDALCKHEQNYSSREVKDWKHALTEIANLKGWDSNVTKPETKLIQEIVDDIQKKLKQMSLSGSPSTILDRFVGITSRVTDIESLLSFESVPGVLIVGIWGIGGIGKTTTAEVVYHRNSRQFEGCCFFRNVREESKKHGLIHVLQEILREVLDKDELRIRTKVLDLDTKRMLQRRKVLIVLDDVISPRDLKDLVGEDGLFGQGSRIIVTSRDRQVLINQCEEDQIYEVKDLDEPDALQLFSLHAFKQNYPVENYAQLSKKVLSYVKGIPLVLEVLGCNLYKRSVGYWESKLAQLGKHGDKDVHKTLETCYNELDEIAQKIFLDIACFFGMYNKDVVLETLDLDERNGFSRLIDMCLIKETGSKIWMHDDLQHLGKEIVRRQNVDDPGKRSRLWELEDVCHVLTNNQGTEKVEAISVVETKSVVHHNVTWFESINLSPTAFKGMNKIRLLRWHTFTDCHDGLEFLSNELRVLKWSGYPLDSLPSNFSPEKLVELKIEVSCFEQFWNKHPLLVNLKFMDLSSSYNLSLIDADFSRFPNLVKLNLSYCCDLRSLPDSIGELKCLVKLNLSECEELTCLPNSIGQLECLVHLNLHGCIKLTSLPNSIYHLESLEVLNVGECYRLSEFPKNQRSSETEEIQANHKQLHNLTCLKLFGSGIRYLLELPPSLHILNAKLCKSLESVASIFTQGEEEYEAGSEDFRFDDCDKLDQNSGIKIIGDARLRIQRMARSSFKQGFAGVDDSGELIKFRLSIPGLEVPEWFMYRNSEGSSLEKIKPPADWCSTNHFLGFAFCAVVRFNGFCVKSNIRCESRLITEGGDHRYIVHVDERYYVSSIHILIWYNYDWRGIIKSNCLFDEASFHFYPGCNCGDSTAFTIPNCLVLKCGVHPLFAQDDREPRSKRLKQNV